MKAREIVDSVVASRVGDYSIAFKLLGFLVFLAEEGPDPFLAGNLLSPRPTIAGWNLCVDAGWGGLRWMLGSVSWSASTRIPASEDCRSIVRDQRSWRRSDRWSGRGRRCRCRRLAARQAPGSSASEARPWAARRSRAPLTRARLAAACGKRRR